MTAADALERMYNAGWRLIEGGRKGLLWTCVWERWERQVRGRSDIQEDAVLGAYRAIRRQYGERGLR